MDEPSLAQLYSQLMYPLQNVGMTTHQIVAWASLPTPLLSGLTPGDAVLDPATRERAFIAAERFAARRRQPGDG